MSLGEIIFFFTIVVTMAGALTAVLAGSIVHAILGLITAMFGVAGLYVYLNSTFLAMMEILVYVGAISILIAFAIMLLGPYSNKYSDIRALGKLTLAFVTALVSVYMFFKFILTNLEAPPVSEYLVTTRDIGRAFTDNLVLPFELISLLIVVAIIGAVMLAIISRSVK
jgi:NADH-quinone oxidoreductase subunit J